ncbi:MAG: HEPN domain-containing protein [Candidatus Kapabacteria bacterium]|nr:HEPN domain-containing protein [Candidatus Kapabacteria bacterium]
MNGSKNDYINYRLSKSKEIFEDAILLADNQRWNSCVNRLYYSSFYFVSSLLIKQGVKSESHNGVKTQFNLHFIKSGKLDIKYGKLYSNLFHWRQESDYADFIDFDEETVKPLINEVIEFNSELIKLFD